MADQILYFEYEYFQLEGIPPYPSPYVPINMVQRFWVDLNDPNRFWSERRFRTREASPREGMERTVKGTGTGGVLETCNFYEGRAYCAQQTITTTVSFDEWLTANAGAGRRFVKNANMPEANGGYEYKGIEIDETWGEVHTFVRRGVLTASDLYKDHPMIETLSFDTKLYRQISWQRIVDDSVLHASLRLIAWKTIASSEAPPEIFAPGR
jgi:hypothetical protein